MTVTRRRFNVLLGASTAATTLALPNIARAAKPRVVVIGGGSGGGTAARYIAKGSKGAIDVTLIEPAKRYYTCFFPTSTSAACATTPRSATATTSSPPSTA